MTDHIIPLPSTFQYVNQFAPSQWAPHPSNYRCVTATMAMCAEIAYAGRWNPPQLEDQLYTRFAGPDVPTDQQGLTKAQVLTWFHEVGIGFIDLADMLSDDTALKAEIQAQNEQGVAQLITVADESKLYDAVSGVKLHNWADTGLSHCFLRVGFSDDQGYGLYYEPAAPGFTQPVPISWDNSIMPAGVITAVAIMPAGVPVPPAGFRYTSGKWPEPKPMFDATKAESTLAASMAALDAIGGALANLAHDLAVLKGEI